MKNYICIDGKKAELTPEQLQALGIEIKNSNPFERAAIGEEYWVVTDEGYALRLNEENDTEDNKLYAVGNYCTDKAIMEQRALHEVLNRLLWRYSMEHNGDKIDWHNDNTPKCYVFYDHYGKSWNCSNTYCANRINCVHFYDAQTARNAIEEIIKPFIEEHPEFDLTK